MLIKQKFHLLFFLWVGLFPNFGEVKAAVITGQEPITVNLGIGANVSYLVFNESTLAPVPIRYAWRYNGLTNPLSGTNWTGEDLFQGVISASAGTEYALSVGIGAYGLYTDFTIGGNQSRVINPLDTPVWTYWISGGSEYVEYGDNGAFTFDATLGGWMISPSYAATRWISNGSYDGWTLAEFAYPGTSPTSYIVDQNGVLQPVTVGTYSGMDPQVIPEPGVLPLCLFSVAFLLVLRAFKIRQAA
jgi:hypothetical protein